MLHARVCNGMNNIVILIFSTVLRSIQKDDSLSSYNFLFLFSFGSLLELVVNYVLFNLNFCFVC